MFDDTDDFGLRLAAHAISVPVLAGIEAMAVVQACHGAVTPALGCAPSGRAAGTSLETVSVAT